jgi:hypothetical protein
MDAFIGQTKHAFQVSGSDTAPESLVGMRNISDKRHLSFPHQNCISQKIFS